MEKLEDLPAVQGLLHYSRRARVVPVAGFEIENLHGGVFLLPPRLVWLDPQQEMDKYDSSIKNARIVWIIE